MKLGYSKNELMNIPTSKIIFPVRSQKKKNHSKNTTKTGSKYTSANSGQISKNSLGIPPTNPRRRRASKLLTNQKSRQGPNHWQTLFSAVKKHKKRTKFNQKIALKKKNLFLTIFSVDLKFNQDSEENEYLTAVCHIEKFTKPKAEILVDSSSRIIGHNSTAGQVIGSPSLELAKSGISKLSDILDSEIGVEEMAEHSELPSANLRAPLPKKKVSVFYQSTNSLIKIEDIASGKSSHRLKSFFSRNWEKTTGNLSQVTNRFKANNSVLATQRTQQMGDKINIEVENLANYPKGVFLVKIWKSDFHVGLTESVAPSRHFRGSAMHQSNAQLCKTTKNIGGFFFKLDHNFEFVGSFDKNFSKPSTNLHFTKLSDFKKVTSSVQILINLRSPTKAKNQEKDEKRVDYGEGIRIKRLVNGNLIDYYEGMDMDSEDLEELEQERLRERQLEEGSAAFGGRSKGLKRSRIDLRGEKGKKRGQFDGSEGRAPQKKKRIIRGRTEKDSEYAKEGEQKITISGAKSSKFLKRHQRTINIQQLSKQRNRLEEDYYEDAGDDLKRNLNSIDALKTKKCWKRL